MAADNAGKTSAGEIVDPDSQVVSVTETCDKGANSTALLSAMVADSCGVEKPSGKDRFGLASGDETSSKMPGSEADAIVANATNDSDKWRFQIRLENGYFTETLKNELMRDLNVFLYSSSGSSFIPCFKGSGLRFGIVWFTPDNEDSFNWIVDKLKAINEKAGECKFIIEPYSVRQNKICLNLPWDTKEGLTEGNVLERLKFQNPCIPINHWRVINSQSTNSGNKLVMCTIDDTSLKLLEKQKFRLNYGFHTVQADVLPQKKSAKNQK